MTVPGSGITARRYVDAAPGSIYTAFRAGRVAGRPMTPGLPARTRLEVRSDLRHPLRLLGEQQLAALPTAVGSARRFVRWALRRYEPYDHELADTAQLVTSELVTNAVRATGLVVARPSYVELVNRRLDLLVVRLGLSVSVLRIEVWDSVTHPPERHEPALDDEDGRGLFLVDQLSEAWGYYHPPTGGKVVWAELPRVDG